MIAHHVAVIGDENNHGIVCKSKIAQCFIETIDLLVNKVNISVVTGFYVVMHAFFAVSKFGFTSVFHLVLVKSRYPLAHGPGGKFALTVFIPEPLRRIEGGMGPVEGHIEQERLRGIAAFEEVEGFVGNPACGVEPLLVLPGACRHLIAADPRFRVIGTRVREFAPQEIHVIVSIPARTACCGARIMEETVVQKNVMETAA